MRNVRTLTLTALLVVVLGLSACTVTLPAVSAGLSTLNHQLGNLLPRAANACRRKLRRRRLRPTCRSSCRPRPISATCKWRWSSFTPRSTRR